MRDLNIPARQRDADTESIIPPSVGRSEKLPLCRVVWKLNLIHLYTENIQQPYFTFFGFGLAATFASCRASLLA